MFTSISLISTCAVTLACLASAFKRPNRPTPATRSHPWHVIMPSTVLISERGDNLHSSGAHALVVVNSLLRRGQPAAFGCVLKNALSAVGVEYRWYIALSLSPISAYQIDPSGGILQALRGNLYVSKYFGVRYVCQVIFTDPDGMLRSCNATSPPSLPSQARVHGVSANAKHFYSGQNIHLICRTPSFSQPFWTWTNGTEIKPGGLHPFVDRIGNLRIAGATRNDSDTFRCCGKIPNEEPLPGACKNYSVDVIDRPSAPRNVSLHRESANGRSGLVLSWKSPAQLGESPVLSYKAVLSCSWRIVGRNAPKHVPVKFPVAADKRQTMLDRYILRKCRPTDCRKVHCTLMSVTAKLKAVNKRGPSNSSEASTWRISRVMKDSSWAYMWPVIATTTNNHSTVSLAVAWSISLRYPSAASAWLSFGRQIGPRSRSLANLGCTSYRQSSLPFSHLNSILVSNFKPNCPADLRLNLALDQEGEFFQDGPRYHIESIPKDPEPWTTRAVVTFLIRTSRPNNAGSRLKRCAGAKRLKRWTHEKTKLCKGRIPEDFDFVSYRPACEPCKNEGDKCRVLRSTFPFNSDLSSKGLLDCLVTSAKKLDASSQSRVRVVRVSVLNVMTNVLDEQRIE